MVGVFDPDFVDAGWMASLAAPATCEDRRTASDWRDMRRNACGRADLAKAGRHSGSESPLLTCTYTAYLIYL